jgi:uncharacterized protein YjbI with pentapeptide repeats
MSLEKIKERLNKNKSTQEQKRNNIELLLNCAIMENREWAKNIITIRTQELINNTGRGFDLTDAILKLKNLSGFDLRYSIFEDTILSKANLSDCDLRGSLFNSGSYHRVSFRNSDLSSSNLHSVAFHVCDFSNSNLDDLTDATYSKYHGCEMQGSTWRSSNLESAVFEQCNLSESNFDRALLSDANFESSDLEKSILTKIKAARVKFSNCVLKRSNFNSAYLYNSTLEGSAKNIMDLSEADFTDTVLTRAKLFANLKNSIFENSLLINSRLDLCNFIDTQLKGVIISDGTTARKIQL